MSRTGARPRLVQEAHALARQQGFSRSCSDEFGRLLRLLAAARPAGRLGEIGTGCGVGSAWLCSGTGAAAELVTVERDAARAAAVHRLLSSRPGVRVLHGSWPQLTQHGPFDLLFVDAPGAKDRPAEVLPLLAVGGLLVMDDFAPGLAQDPRRQAWLERPETLAVEVQVSDREAALLIARRP